MPRLWRKSLNDAPPSATHRAVIRRFSPLRQHIPRQRLLSSPLTGWRLARYMQGRRAPLPRSPAPLRTANKARQGATFYADFPFLFILRAASYLFTRRLPRQPSFFQKSKIRYLRRVASCSVGRVRPLCALSGGSMLVAAPRNFYKAANAYFLTSPPGIPAPIAERRAQSPRLYHVPPNPPP